MTSAQVLVGAHDLAQVFRVELAGEAGGVHQVTEQHGELAAFGLTGRRVALGGGSWRGWTAWGHAAV